MRSRVNVSVTAFASLVAEYVIVGLKLIEERGRLGGRPPGGDKKRLTNKPATQHSRRRQCWPAVRARPSGPPMAATTIPYHTLDHPDHIVSLYRRWETSRQATRQASRALGNLARSAGRPRCTPTRSSAGLALSLQTGEIYIQCM